MKTLKDFGCDNGYVKIIALKQNVIKYIKYFRSKKTNCKHCRDTGTQVYGDGHVVDDDSRIDVIGFIKWFFNITEENLK